MQTMTIQQFLNQPTIPKNLPIAILGSIDNIKETGEAIKEFTTTTKDFFIGISKLFEYLTHPAQLGMLIWNGIVKYSLPICLTICILSLLLHLTGYDKAKKFISGSFFCYLIIEMINTAI